MHRNFIYLLGTSLALLCSCSTSARVRPQDHVERISDMSQGALVDVLAARSSFELAYEDAVTAWQRTQMFFSKYAKNQRTLGGRNAAVVVAGASRFIESLSGESEHYLWEVQRQEIAGGYRFTVNCHLRLGETPSFEQEDLLDQNERNLARFIESGQLELTLLKL